jgi:2-isopropylmalate synthase
VSSPVDPGYVRIFDTTLRDGEQSPGATLDSGQKLELARALSRLGVDVIEAGFPAASPDDLRAVARIAESVGTSVPAGRPAPCPPTICALARACEPDIELAWQGVQGAAFPRIHTFLATSPIHREHKLKLSKREVLARVERMVRQARSLASDVEFSAEDAARTEIEFLCDVMSVAIEAGASTINVPDTVGYTTPDEFGARIAELYRRVPGIENVVVSVHCHDDLGLATANSLAGVRAGARQIEVAVNGIGERAGNTALEEVVMVLATRRALYGLRTGIDTREIARTSKLVSLATGIVVQPNKAVVGANAFSHESGIHQDGMLKHEETYEIMRPEDVGAGKTRLVLGKHSGRHAFAARLAELGYALDGAELDRAFCRFKALAEKKKAVTDADLEVLCGARLSEPLAGGFGLDALQIGCGTVGLSTATVRLRTPAGTLETAAAVGAGPVDAAFKAVDAIVGRQVELTEYAVQAVTEGIDALGQVSVRVKSELLAVAGHGADTDILVASTKAYLGALNRLLSAERASAVSAAE